MGEPGNTDYRPIRKLYYIIIWGLEDHQHVDILKTDAMQFANNVWNEIGTITIRNCETHDTFIARYGFQPRSSWRQEESCSLRTEWTLQI